MHPFSLHTPLPTRSPGRQPHEHGSDGAVPSSRQMGGSEQPPHSFWVSAAATTMHPFSLQTPLPIRSPGRQPHEHGSDGAVPPSRQAGGSEQPPHSCRISLAAPSGLEDDKGAHPRHSTANNVQVKRPIHFIMTALGARTGPAQCRMARECRSCHSATRFVRSTPRWKAADTVPVCAKAATIVVRHTCCVLRP